MKLKKLIDGLDLTVKGSKEIDILGLCSDSRRIVPGHLFIAKRGSSFDGAEFIPQAVQNGAAAVLTELYNPFLGKLVQLIHPHPEKIEAELAKRFYKNPSAALFLFGATGTNGKTTTTYLVKHLLDALNRPCGLSSTVETVIGTRRLASTLTTHDVLSNQRMLREMSDGKATAAAIEVSSHGLAQGRLDGLEFDAALFTNLTPDHLDYHITLQEYASAKKRLFALLDASPKKNKCAIVNADDPMSEALLENCKAKKLFFGLGQRADIRAEGLLFSPSGTTFSIQNELFQTKLIGQFNVYNLLGAIALGVHLGVPLKELAAIFASFETVPGRLERVKTSRPIHLFIDYAHTEDALANVLVTLRAVAKARIIVVFGAGGNRDPGRRRGLARAASKGADFSIITNDNPRKEDPEVICREILSGFEQKERVKVELDRKKAIHLAIDLAKEEDIVLIAGKGHERVQIFSYGSVPFDDCEIAREYAALQQ